MGGTTFISSTTAKTAREAFNDLVSRASHEYGHGGYTGTIAEKDGFVMHELKSKGGTNKEISREIEDILMDDDHRTSDKHGPAGCCEVEPGLFVFWGWAST